MAEEDQAVRFLPLQHQRVALFALLVVLRVAEQDGMPFALRRVLDALEDQREERVGDVGDRDEQLAGPKRPQVLGGGIRRVGHDLHRVQDAAAGFGRHHLRTAQVHATPSP